MPAELFPTLTVTSLVSDVSACATIALVPLPPEKTKAFSVVGSMVGASVIGPHGSDLIHEIAVAMHFHATAGDLARVPHYHPTLSEIWTYPAEELAGG